MHDRKQGRTQENTFGAHEIVASASECTGLIPALSQEDPDAETNETMLYGVHAPKESLKREEAACREGKGEGGR